MEGDFGPFDPRFKAGQALVISAGIWLKAFKRF